MEPKADDGALEVIDLNPPGAPPPQPVSPPTINRQRVAVVVVVVLPAVMVGLLGLLAVRFHGQRDRAARAGRAAVIAASIRDAEIDRLHGELNARPGLGDVTLGDQVAFTVKGARGGRVSVVIVPVQRPDVPTIVFIQTSGEPTNAVYQVVMGSCAGGTPDASDAISAAGPGQAVLLSSSALARRDVNLVFVVVNEFIVPPGQTPDGTQPVELGGVRSPFDGVLPIRAGQPTCA